MVIFKQTFKRLLTLKFITIYFLIFNALILLLMFVFNRFQDKGNQFYEVLDTQLSQYFVVSFLVILGIPFLIIIVNQATSLFQREIDEGTLLLIITRPISRTRVFFEKLLGAFVFNVLVGIMSILFSLFIIVFYMKIDTAVLQVYLRLLPSLFIYMIWIIIIFTSIGIFVTTLVRSRVISIVVLIMFIMLFELIVPSFNIYLYESELYTKLHMYVFDMNYHFGMMYYYIINIFSPVRFSPVAMQDISQYIGIFNNIGGIDPELGFRPVNSTTLKYINPSIIFLIWFLISSAFLSISFYIFKKRDFAQ